MGSQTNLKLEALDLMQFEASFVISSKSLYIYGPKKSDHKK